MKIIHFSQVGEILFKNKKNKIPHKQQEKFNELILNLCDEYLYLFSRVFFSPIE